ncbi:MAG: zf-HC2 domain-containing protein [Pseudomonadota bacterium]|nr:zf-HC2 domain-containing protein [Pseudomonadota bacterium]
MAEIASDYIDGELSGRQNLSVKMHLMMCKDCRTFIGNLRASSNLLSAHSSGRTDEEFLLRRFGLPEQIQVLTHAGIG